MEVKNAEDALSYLNQVKYVFGNQPQVYTEFLGILKEFRSRSIDTPDVIQRVSNLFRGHSELIVGFNTFLPPGCGIEVQPNDQVQVSIPGTNGAGGQGRTSLTIHPAGPPTATVHPVPQTNHTERDYFPHAPPPAKPPPVVSNQPHANSQHPHHQNSPPRFQSGGVSSGNSPNSAPSPANKSVELKDAMNYVTKIKIRFREQPEIYCRFLELLHTYKKEQLNLKEGVNTANEPLTETEVYNEIANLFQNQEDLLQEFVQFLPHTNCSSLMSLPPPVVSNQPQDNSQGQHPHHQNSPPRSQSGGVSPGSGNSPNSAPSPADRPPEYNDAINFVNKIKIRFREQPEIYRRFLELLNTYEKEQLNLKEGVHTAYKPLTETEVYNLVAELFQNEEDLLQEFGQFIPHTNCPSLMGSLS